MIATGKKYKLLKFDVRRKERKKAFQYQSLSAFQFFSFSISWIIINVGGFW